jgi:hypothetical protein
MKDTFTYKGKEYRKVKRMAKAGELVLITRAYTCLFKNGEVLSIKRVYNDGVLETSTNRALASSQYVVLEPLSQKTIEDVIDTWHKNMRYKDWIDKKTVLDNKANIIDVWYEECTKWPEHGYAYLGRKNGKSTIPALESFEKEMNRIASDFMKVIKQDITQEEFESLKRQLEQTYSDFLVGRGIYKSVVIASFDKQLAELKKRIMPQKRKWTDEQIQEAKDIVMLFNEGTSYMVETDKFHVIGAYWLNPKTKHYQCATATCAPNDTYNYWIGRMVACLKVHDRQLPEWVKGG